MTKQPSKESAAVFSRPLEVKKKELKSSSIIYHQEARYIQNANMSQNEKVSCLPVPVVDRFISLISLSKFDCFYPVLLSCFTDEYNVRHSSANQHQVGYLNFRSISLLHP